MLIFLNGRFVPEQRAVVSVFDRGFLYGDGLFETLRVSNGKLFRWVPHIERFQRGAEFLKIRLPLTPEALRAAAEKLITKNRVREAVLRITLSRGAGLRSYSTRGAESPTLVLTLHPLILQHHPCWSLYTSSLCLPANEPLARFKTANKLPQILARAAADEAGADEALLQDKRGRVIEGTSGNLFWVSNNVVCTPPASTGILPGITRAAILEICRDLKLRTRERAPRAKELFSAQGVFLSLSGWGIVEAVKLDGRKLRRAAIVKKIWQAYTELLLAETT